MKNLTNNLLCLDSNFSTTKLLYKLIDDKCLDENGKIKEECKWSINNSKFNIQNSKLIGSPEDKFETMLFLPEGEGRKGEGGLRTKGYFKFSYENLIMNDECLIMNDKYGNRFKYNPSNSKFNIQNSKLNNNSTSNIQHSTLNTLPLISVITVVFNGEKYLEETIQSVINQTYPNVEYIIIDGGSTDGTLDIIKKYEDKIDYWVSERDSGIYDAWNKAIICSRGEWIGFLGADDFYVLDALSIYKKHLNRNLDYISSSVEIIDVNKNKIKIIGNPWNWKVFKRYMNVAHVGSLHNKQLFSRIGLYDSSYKIAGDYELLLRKQDDLKTEYINKTTAKMRNAGVSNNNIDLVFKETLNAKIRTGERNIIIAYLEYYMSIFKFFIKSFFVNA